MTTNSNRGWLTAYEQTGMAIFQSKIQDNPNLSPREQAFMASLCKKYEKTAYNKLECFWPRADKQLIQSYAEAMALAALQQLITILEESRKSLHPEGQP